MPRMGSVDIASRTRLFRNSLIEEFRLSESDTSNAFEAPKYSSEVFQDADQVADILRHKPHTLIKFKIFKRTPEMVEATELAQVDRSKRKPGRLQKSLTRLPLSVWATWLSGHRYFSNFIIYTILVSAVILGIQTFLDEVEDWWWSQNLELLDYITMVIFVLEIALKWISNFKDFWKDGWNLFDFFVTTGSLLPYVALLFIGSSTEQKGRAEYFATVAKNLRIFRTLKMIAKFRSLRIIVRTIMEALQSLGFVLILLGLLMYIFAVFAIGLFEDYSKSTKPGLLYQDKFEDITTSLRTLFQLLTLDQWYNIAKEISSVESINTIVTIAFFVLWVALGAFIFRNIFIGVMVKNFQSISQELAHLDQASKKRARLRKYAQEFHNQLEENRGHIVTGDEEKESPLPPKADLDTSTPLEQSPGEEANSKSKQPKADPVELNTLEADVRKEDEKAKQWQEFIDHSLRFFQEQEQGATLWPRDTLLEYLQTMEKLQENMKEYNELQHLASITLYNILTNS